MRYLVILLLLVVGVYFFSGYESRVDKLMAMRSVNTDVRPGFKQPVFHTEQYDIRKALVPGHITVLYFSSDSCPACRRLNKHFVRFLGVRPDVAVRKFDLGYHWTGDDAYNTYKLPIGKTPFIHIYGPDGESIAKDHGLKEEAFDLLYDWINAEQKKEWQQRQAHAS